MVLIPKKQNALNFTKPNNNYISNSDNLLGAIEEMLLEFPEDSFYFLNEGDLRDRIRLIDQHFLPNNPNKKVAYAIKANSRRRILEILYKEGMTHFDCASPKEIALIKDLDPDTIPLYNHPIKRKIDIREAANMGALHFTAQTKREINKIINEFDVLPSNLEVVARMQTLNNKAACNLSTKFGAPPEEVKQMLQYLDRENINKGISVHTGSQNSDPATMETGVEKMVQVIRETGKVKVLNVGGGLPANYLGNSEYDVRVYLNAVSEAILAVLGDIFDSDDYKVIIEPGRGIVGDVVQLTSPVIATEERNGAPCIYINDGVFSSFCPADPPNFNADLKVLRKEGSNIIEVEPAKGKDFVVFGRTCDSADTLGMRRLPSDTQEGDWILHTSAGAYAESCSSDFNNFQPHTWVSFNT